MGMVLEGNPGDGDEVTYDVGTDDRNGKLCANNVVVIGGGTGKGRPPKGMGKGGGGMGACFNCGQEGHIARDCPLGPRDDGYGGKGFGKKGGGKKGGGFGKSRDEGGPQI